MPLQNMRYFNLLKYWVKLLNCNENIYNRKIYKLRYQDIIVNPNIVNWFLLTRDLLCTLGFYDAWLFQNVGDVKLFLLNIKRTFKGPILARLVR